MDDRVIEVYIQQMAKNGEITASTLQAMMLQLKATEIKLDQILSAQNNPISDIKSWAKWALAVAIALVSAGAGWQGIGLLVNVLSGG